MTSDANKAALNRYVKEVWMGGDLSAVQQFIAPDYVRHDAGLPMPVRGPEAVAQLIGLYRAAFPDLSFIADIMLADGDVVAVHWQVRGTHQGDLMGIPPSGKPIAITATEIFRFADDKIAEQWVTVDNAGLFRQIGAMP